ncbi:MAG: FAD:protein FMN transferase [Planctomycetota bacterium]|jgi:thiamine biosynthesis lipoprotein
MARAPARLLYALILLPALLVVPSCGGARPTHLAGKAMGTFFTVDYGGDAEPDRVMAKVRTTLNEWGALFSTYRKDSEISRFNAHNSTELFAASPEFSLMVFEALELAAKTGGAFDPTIVPLLRLYGFGPGVSKPTRPPDDDAIQAAMAKCGYQKLSRLAGKGLTKQVPDLELDLNAIAKGAGVDRVATVLATELGLEHFMVNIGGEVYCKGNHPEGRPWRLGVETPKSDPVRGQIQLAETVELRDEAMATSGSYRQFHSFEGQEVHHILDPRTGRNAKTNVVSVSVVASSCSTADGLATALMVVGPDACEEILARYPGMNIRVLFLLRGEGGKLEQKGFRWE